MLPIQHPLAKTDIEARRAIQRLDNFIRTSPIDETQIETAERVRTYLIAVRAAIPDQYRDTDIVGE